ncbi:MAG: alcohol dehydrogenase catalytic domain-containing protein, partial [Thermodesulfovibrionales bacterium]|nr:alcohol dehydrogenase catalytic domain-containing protein [Thermodesulfovibrionales bacterium]
MVLTKLSSFSENRSPLSMEEMTLRSLGGKEILIKVSSCGVCHTELDEIEGRLPPSKLPIILGHQIIGYVEKIGREVTKFKVGDRVGIGWINSACGECFFCLQGKENLCNQFIATGKDVDGGYSEYTIATEDFAFTIPEFFSDTAAAPLLCAGAIGYRSLSLCNFQDRQNIGLIGFGSSAHLVIQLVHHLYPNSKVFVFARSESERNFAKSLGAYWTG